VDVGIVGGTGPLGSGLGARISASGFSVRLGSRDPSRAGVVVEGLHAQWGAKLGSITGGSNEDAAEARIVVISTPWDVLTNTVEPLKALLANKIVVSVANALTRMGPEFVNLTIARGSLAQGIQSSLPTSMVVGAFHHVPAKDLGDLDRPVEADTLVCSDFAFATTEMISLIDAIPGMRGIDAGSLAQAGAIEAMTAVLLNVNLKYQTRSSLRLSGIERR
jgi:NADPH-dependent F420 reductase